MRRQRALPRSLRFAHTDLGGMVLFEEASGFGVKAAELGMRAASWLQQASTSPR